MLNFVEEIVLLQLDDQRGRFIDLPLSAANVVVAGAALMELALQNRIDTDLQRLIVVDPKPTGDEVLDDVLARLAKEPVDLTTAAAIDRIAEAAESYQQTAIEQLKAKGILREEDGRFLWVFHTRRYPVVDDREQREVKARLRELLLSDDIPDPRDLALVCLIDACNLLGLLLAPDEMRKTAGRVEQLGKMDLIGQAVRHAVAEIRAVVASAGPAAF